MNPKSIFKQLAAQAKDQLLSAPILNQIDSINTRQLHYLFSQIYYFVDRFPSLLGLLLWHASDERIRFVIVDNLIDEFGGAEKIHRNDYSSTHSKLLKQFVLSMEVPEKGLANKSIHTEILLNNFNQLFMGSTTIEALGSMTSMESLSTDWFSLIYRQLKQRNEFSPESLHFFELHMQLDEVHGSVLEDVLMPLIQSDEDLALLKHGIMSSASNWGNFYSELANELHILK